MTVDFTKFPFPGLHRPQAATVTEAITAEPVAAGFVIITLRATDTDGFAAIDAHPDSIIAFSTETRGYLSRA